MMRFDFTFGGPRAARRRDDTRQRLLLLADFGGDVQQTPVSHRPIARVDIDNVDEVLARRCPSVTLGPESGGQRLELRSIEDLHPDALVDRIPACARLLDLRSRLKHPSTFAAAAAELGLDSSRPIGSSDAAAKALSDDGMTLERLLGRRPDPPSSPAPPAQAVSTVDGLIRRIIAPHVVAATDPQALQLVSAVDAALTDMMRAVLHDPAFQGAEATWRGLHWLVSSLELGDDLELHVLHVTRDELSRGVASGSDLHRRLVDDEAQTAGGLEWAAIIGHYRFDATVADLSALQSAGELARALDAPFVGEAGASLLGSSGLAGQPDPREWVPLEPEIEARWRALRESPAAASVGLALPRFLLRLPYGRRSDPIERFAFEELSGTPEHARFLWGNAALACAVVIARVLAPADDTSDPGYLAGLPAYVSGDGDESHLQPCAEVYLGERAVEAILARGIMPLVSMKDEDAARFVRLQSIADPPTALVD